MLPEQEQDSAAGHQPITIHNARSATTISIVVMLIMLVTFTIHLSDRPSTCSLWLLSICTLFLLLIHTRMIISAPIITIDSGGIHYHSIRHRQERYIYWNEIGAIRQVMLKEKEAMVCIYPTIAGMQSYCVRNGLRLPSSPPPERFSDVLTFDCGATNMPYKTFIARLRKQYPDELERYHIEFDDE